MSSMRLYYESMGPYAPQSQTWYHNRVKARYSLPSCPSLPLLSLCSAHMHATAAHGVAALQSSCSPSTGTMAPCSAKKAAGQISLVKPY